MITLAIETSAKTFSIALSRGDILIGEVFWHTDFNHSEKLIPAIEWLLKNLNLKLNQIDKVAVSTGPGSFTGIRVGLACAKTLSQNIGIGFVCADSFDILSESVNCRDCAVIPIIDALRGEVFVKFNKKISIWTIKALAEKINSAKSTVVLAGSGLVSYGPSIKKLITKKDKVIFSNVYYPKAGVLALMSGRMKTINFNLARPLYIRRSWADEKKDKSLQRKNK